MKATLKTKRGVFKNENIIHWWWQYSKYCIQRAQGPH
jgi:hypothetical protein